MTVGAGCDGKSRREQVFDVLLNHEHIIVDGIDIFDRSGAFIWRYEGRFYERSNFIISYRRSGYRLSGDCKSDDREILIDPHF